MLAAASDVDPLRSLLRAAHLLAPDLLGPAVADAARLMGAAEAVVYLADYEQLHLHPLPGRGVPPRQALTVDGSAAGRAFRKVEVVRTAGPNGRSRMWLPLLDGVTRLGVLELDVPAIAAPDPGSPPGRTPAVDLADAEDEAGPFAALVAEMLVNGDAGSDLFARLRRRKTLSLAAEIQWDLLPPLAFATDRVVVAGALEPAYDIGGDTFDYAVNGPTTDVAVLDAVGHGLPAALLAAAAIGAYRHARRSRAELPDIAVAIDQVISGQFAESRFATAALARLDLDSGRMRWINAGHPAPLLIRDGSLLPTPTCVPSRPLGLLADKPVECELQLRPGDRVLFHTDGIVEARSPGGDYFGERRLADFVIRAHAAGDAAPETLRRLMRSVLAHQADQLQDDASIVMLEWRTGEESALTIRRTAGPGRVGAGR